MAPSVGRPSRAERNANRLPASLKHGAALTFIRMAEEHLWTDDLRDLALWCGINALPDSPKGRVAAAVLQARLALAQADAANAAAEASRAAASASRSTAKATWALVAVTWALALATVFLALTT
jgi:hypothetical protein